ncbi:MAG: glycosyltransferase, partial [Buchananella hordeovulneris]|nr:glycosyltransferase [Buchananella hordeovulneris]
DGKDAFIKAARTRWENTSGVEVRYHQVDQHDWNLRETLRLRLTGQPTPIPEFLAADLAWADVVVVEWGAAAAARISGMAFPGKLVVRLHRFEAFTVMPLLFNLPGIDHLVFEVAAVREAWQRAVGDAAAGVDAPVIPLECELRHFELPKEGDWRHTLALVGCSSNVKDPQWALDLLALLRERDAHWRLLLVGDVLSSTLTGSPEELRYVERVRAALAVPDCGVEQLGFRTDIPEVLRSVGVIVSSSLVEGTHAAVLEGAASGCLPVVRDWPHVAAIGGARANFPAHWIVDTPQEAAQRILAWDQELDLPARDYVVDRWDSSQAGPLLDSLVLDDAAVRP